MISRIDSQNDANAQDQVGEQLHIDFLEIRIGKKIGEGTFGIVHKAKLNDQKCAVKRFKLNDLEDSQKLITKETEALKSLKHECVLSLICVATDPELGGTILVMEYMKDGSLEDLLKDNDVQLSREDVIQIVLDVARGLQYLHSQKIIHRDLKSANVLLYNNRKNAKLSDFGTVRVFKNSTRASTVVGTNGFMAPEILHEEPYNTKADVYSFGALLYNMLTRKGLPILFKSDAAAITRIESNVSDIAFRNLIIQCCKANPEQRPTIEECIKILQATMSPETPAQECFDEHIEFQVPQKKILIVGEENVGKTSLVKRLKSDWFYSLKGSSRTEGVDVHRLEISKHNFVSVWDFAGQEHLLSHHKLYFTKNSVCVIAVQLNDSYEQIKSQLAKWMFIVHQLCPESKVIVVATKLDLLKPTELHEKTLQIDHAISTLLEDLQISLEINDENELSTHKFFAVSFKKSKNISKIADTLQRLSKSKIYSTLKGSGSLLKLIKESKEMSVDAKFLAAQSQFSIQTCIRILRHLEELGMIILLTSSKEDEEAIVILDGDLISKVFNQLKIKFMFFDSTSKAGWIDFNLAKSFVSGNGRVKFNKLIEVLEKAQLIYVEKQGEVKDWKIFIPQIALNNSTEELPKKGVINFSMGRVYVFKNMLPIGFFEQLSIQMQSFAKITACGIQMSSHGIELFGDSEVVYVRKNVFVVQIISQSGEVFSAFLAQQVIKAFEESLVSYFKDEQTVAKFVQRLVMQ